MNMFVVYQRYLIRNHSAYGTVWVSFTLIDAWDVPHKYARYLYMYILRFTSNDLYIDTKY